MAALAERIYRNSPLWAQQMTVAGYGWWWYRRRFGPHFHRLQAEFGARERWSAKQFHVYQQEQLGKIFTAAWRSPYYHQVLTHAGINPGMEPFDILPRMPVLSKETLRTKARDLLTQNPTPKGTIIFKSSGTTGTPTEIYYTPEYH